MATKRDFVVKNGLVVTEDIELGHADDTTIARASAGQITVEGTAVVLAGSASHDGFSDFVANEHIDHTGVSISAGNGLTGGGTIASTRTLAVGAGTGVTVNANDVAIGQAVGTSDDVTFSTVTLASDLIHSGDTNNKIAFGTDTQSFQTGGTARFNISDSGLQIGSGARVTEIENNDSLGTSDTKLATQGNIKAYVDANAGGASALGSLDDVTMDATNFTDGLLIQTNSDGSAPTTGTLSGANDNIGIGKNVFSALTSGDNNLSIGNNSGDAINSGHRNVLLGHNAGSAITTGNKNTVIGANAIETGGTGAVGNTVVGYGAIGSAGNGIDNNTAIGFQALSACTNDHNIAIGYTAGNNITSGEGNVVIGAADVDTATGDHQISISSGDGNHTWIKGDSNGIKALKIKVKAVSSTHQLTDAQSGSYVYWTAGSLTLPDSAESGQQYTVINNTGGSATPALGSSNSIASGWTSHAAMADETARTYVAVATNTWIYIG